MVGTSVSQHTVYYLDIRQFLFKSEHPGETTGYGLLFFPFGVLSMKLENFMHLCSLLLQRWWTIKSSSQVLVMLHSLCQPSLELKII